MFARASSEALITLMSIRIFNDILPTTRTDRQYRRIAAAATAKKRDGNEGIMWPCHCELEAQTDMSACYTHSRTFCSPGAV